MPDGILVLDKPSGPTSHDMVYLVRRGTGEKRAGHAGTLDPLATGVLVMCVGAATRLSEYLIGEDKRYAAVVRLGAATDTYDAQGTVTATAPVNVSQAQIEAALGEFRGAILQRPPAYSALKRGGQKAYEMARRGEAVQLEPRAVTIYALTLDDYAPPDARLSVHCSAGTYIRSLAHDLGQRLGCGAHLASLRRTAAGHFAVAQAVTVDDLQAAFEAGTWARYLQPPQAALPHWPRITAGPERLLNGSPVPDGEWQLAQPGSAAIEAGTLALAFDAADRLLAVVERDEAARHWQPRKVFARGK